ncbi:MAG: hypothetical protein GDA36_08090 [Rhodobacteraceae bacterium]|nr:hypothetical protein [Paracoccaceae bacterium]
MSNPLPIASDRALTDEEDGTETAKTPGTGHNSSHGAHTAFTESNLPSMGMVQFFHPNAKWYEPSGFRVCLLLNELETLYQQPWQVAVPDHKALGLKRLFAKGRILIGFWCGQHAYKPYLAPIWARHQPKPSQSGCRASISESARTRCLPKTGALSP